MKITKIISFLLVCVMLFSAVSIAVSAEKVDFMPEKKNGRIYGISLNTKQSAFRVIYYEDKPQIYDRDGNLLAEDSDVIMGTGFTVKLNNRMFYTAVVMGDVDGDGDLTPSDYLLVKRTCLGTYSIGSLGEAAAGVKDGEKLRSIHYVMMKRAYFGTYDINKDYSCKPYEPSTGEGWSDTWV